MKTIRQNTFETNSSSTHAVSFSSTLANPPTIRPVANGPITLSPTRLEEEDTWRSKMSLLGLVWKCSTKAQELITIDKLEKVLSEYTGVTVQFDFYKFDKNIDAAATRSPYPTKEENYKQDILLDSYFLGGDGAGFDSVNDFVDTVCEILSDEEKIIRFCFTENIYVVEEWYDG